MKDILHSGVIKCAAILEPNPQTRTTMAVAAIGHSLCLLRIENTVEILSSTPVYTQILDITTCNDGSVLCLAEDGQLHVIYMEVIDDRYRLRVSKRFKALVDEVYEGLPPFNVRQFRKLVCDPISRPITAVVCWVNHIEFLISGQLDASRLYIDTGGVICDSVILTPSPSEHHRVLLVCAVMSKAEQTSICLHLYEIWMEEGGSVNLLAKLPLPLDMDMPLHAVGLPQIPECFLLVTETEVAYVSALQILCGDVYLYRQKLDGGEGNVVRAYCVSNDQEDSQQPDIRPTIDSPRSDVDLPMFRKQHSSASSIRREPKNTQLVYMACQNGLMLRLEVNDLPTINIMPVIANMSAIAGDTMLYLKDERLFVAGDGADHTIMDVRHGTNYPAFNNMSPMTDFTTTSQAVTTAYSVSGRVQEDGIGDSSMANCVRFGHPVRSQGTLQLDVDAITKIWSLTLLGSPCLVLQQPQGCLAIIKDENSGWRVLESLNGLINIANGPLVSITGGYQTSPSTCIIQSVFRDCIDIYQISTEEECQVRLSQPANTNCAYTHGVCLETSDNAIWSIVGIRTMSSRTSILRAVCLTTTDPVSVEVELQYEISCIRAFPVPEPATASGIYIIVGTYEPRLVVYHLEHNPGQPPSMTRLDIDLPLSLQNHPNETDYSSQVVNDVYLLYRPNATFILAGLRSGGLLELAIDGLFKSQHAASIANVTRINVGQMPIQFVDSLDCGSRFRQRVVLVSYHMYLAELGNDTNISIRTCIEQSQRDLQAIDHLALLVSSNPNCKHCFFAAWQNGSMDILEIDMTPRCIVDGIILPNFEPRHIVYDQWTGLLVIGGTIKSHSDTRSQIRVIDPESGKIHTQILLQPLEHIHSLCIWHINGPKSYRYLCVGTSTHSLGSNHDDPCNPSIRDRGGRLLIYNLKTAKSRKSRNAPGAGYELKYLWATDRSMPVLALAPLGDASLVVASGTCCFVLKLDVVQKQLIECFETSIRFVATSLNVCQNRILVGSQREGMHVLELSPDEDSLSMLHASRFSGSPTADVRLVAPDLAVAVDGQGYLYGMAIPTGSKAGPGEFALDCLFGVHLGVECMRIHQANLVNSLHPSAHVLPWSTLRRNSNIVVSTITGALWTLVRISQDAYGLLCQLETAMLAMDDMHPARPLFVDKKDTGSIQRRAGGDYKASRGVANKYVVDGTLSTWFTDGLTDIEQQQVVGSSLDLQRKALALTTHNSSNGDGDVQMALSAICQVIGDINISCT